MVDSPDIVAARGTAVRPPPTEFRRVSARVDYDPRFRVYRCSRRRESIRR